jgi:REP element-mobilizing transposase RayT
MPDNLNQTHLRRSIRLQGYDYSQTGAYYVTLCVQNRECLFGFVENDEMKLNPAGLIVQSVWNGLSEYFQGIDIDASVVMPNHLHGIIVIDGSTEPGQTRRSAPTMALSEVVQRFKTFTTTKYGKGIVEENWSPFPGKLWQRNYYEHIIRNETALNKIREYIFNNPAKWVEDRENPNHL